MNNETPKAIPINEFRQEEGADELATSPDMEPYIRWMMAGMRGSDASAELEAIANLPLEKRYIWRLVSALKWAFADFDNVNVSVDRKTLSKEDLTKVVSLVRLRPIQFCLFLKALFGEEGMERIMQDAIVAAKGAP